MDREMAKGPFAVLVAFQGLIEICTTASPSLVGVQVLRGLLLCSDPPHLTSRRPLLWAFPASRQPTNDVICTATLYTATLPFSLFSFRLSREESRTRKPEHLARRCPASARSGLAFDFKIEAGLCSWTMCAARLPNPADR